MSLGDYLSRVVGNTGSAQLGAEEDLPEISAVGRAPVSENLLPFGFSPRTAQWGGSLRNIMADLAGLKTTDPFRSRMDQISSLQYLKQKHSMAYQNLVNTPFLPDSVKEYIASQFDDRAVFEQFANAADVGVAIPQFFLGIAKNVVALPLGIATLPIRKATESGGKLAAKIRGYGSVEEMIDGDMDTLASYFGKSKEELMPDSLKEVFLTWAGAGDREHPLDISDNLSELVRVPIDVVSFPFVQAWSLIKSPGEKLSREPFSVFAALVAGKQGWNHTVAKGSPVRAFIKNRRSVLEATRGDLGNVADKGVPDLLEKTVMEIAQEGVVAGEVPTLFNTISGPKFIDQALKQSVKDILVRAKANLGGEYPEFAREVNLIYDGVRRSLHDATQLIPDRVANKDVLVLDHPTGGRMNSRILLRDQMGKPSVVEYMDGRLIEGYEQIRGLNPAYEFAKIPDPVHPAWDAAYRRNAVLDEGVQKANLRILKQYWGKEKYLEGRGGQERLLNPREMLKQVDEMGDVMKSPLPEETIRRVLNENFTDIGMLYEVITGAELLGPDGLITPAKAAKLNPGYRTTPMLKALEGTGIPAILQVGEGLINHISGHTMNLFIDAWTDMGIPIPKNIVEGFRQATAGKASLARIDDFVKTEILRASDPEIALNELGQKLGDNSALGILPPWATQDMAIASRKSQIMAKLKKINPEKTWEEFRNGSQARRRAMTALGQLAADAGLLKFRDFQDHYMSRYKFRRGDATVSEGQIDMAFRRMRDGIAKRDPAVLTRAKTMGLLDKEFTKASFMQLVDTKPELVLDIIGADPTTSPYYQYMRRMPAEEVAKANLNPVFQDMQYLRYVLHGTVMQPLAKMSHNLLNAMRSGIPFDEAAIKPGTKQFHPKAQENLVGAHFNFDARRPIGPALLKDLKSRFDPQALYEVVDITPRELSYRLVEGGKATGDVMKLNATEATMVQNILPNMVARFQRPLLKMFEEYHERVFEYRGKDVHDSGVRVQTFVNKFAESIGKPEWKVSVEQASQLVELFTGAYYAGFVGPKISSIVRNATQGPTLTWSEVGRQAVTEGVEFAQTKKGQQFAKAAGFDQAPYVEIGEIGGPHMISASRMEGFNAVRRALMTWFSAMDRANRLSTMGGAVRVMKEGKKFNKKLGLKDYDGLVQKFLSEDKIDAAAFIYMKGLEAKSQWWYSKHNRPAAWSDSKLATMFTTWPLNYMHMQIGPKMKGLAKDVGEGTKQLLKGNPEKIFTVDELKALVKGGDMKAAEFQNFMNWMAYSMFFTAVGEGAFDADISDWFLAGPMLSGGGYGLETLFDVIGGVKAGQDTLFQQEDPWTNEELREAKRALESIVKGVLPASSAVRDLDAAAQVGKSGDIQAALATALFGKKATIRARND